MKGQTIADIPVIGLIATATIVAFGILPPSIVKTVLDSELSLTYEYENAQYTLFSLLSSTHNGKTVSQIISESEYDSVDLSFIKIELDKISDCYSLKIGLPDSYETIAENGQCEKKYIFTTSIALPYNPDSSSQIKLVRIETG